MCQWDLEELASKLRPFSNGLTDVHTDLSVRSKVTLFKVEFKSLRLPRACTCDDAMHCGMPGEPPSLPVMPELSRVPVGWSPQWDLRVLGIGQNRKKYQHRDWPRAWSLIFL